MDRGTARSERIGERRTRSRFVVSERRSGFDRRRRGGLVPALLQLRDSPAALFALLVAVNVMNLFDLLATTRALAAGLAEGNPVMAGLIATDPGLAAFVKIGVIAVVSAGVWRLRRYRVVLQVGLFMFAVFEAVLLVHYYYAASFY